MEAFAINILLLVEDRGEVSKDLVPRDVPQLEDQLMLVQQQLFVLEASLSCDPAEVPIFLLLSYFILRLYYITQ